MVSQSYLLDQINSQNEHPTLKCSIPKNIKFLKFDKFAEEITKKVDLIVVAVSSKGIEWASNELAKVLNENILILILTKGLSINNNNYEIPAHTMERILKKKGIKDVNISALGGPCLARELVNRTYTSVVIANSNIKLANKIEKLVSTEYYRVFTSEDIIGVGVCAAIKNIFAMSIGSIRELNSAATVFDQSIKEMIIFTEQLKGKKETVMGLAGSGDLYVSVQGGRNSKMGQYMSQGLTYSEAKKTKMPNETIEGADLAFEIGNKVKKDFNHKSLPLMISMIEAVCDDRKLEINWNYFR